MTRPALAAARAVDVLDFLAAHPLDAFSLSEIARALDVSMASELAVLRALAEAGYVHRHPRHKTYSLGPALVAVGRAALARHPVAEDARAEMRTLAERCDAECVASLVVGEEIVIVGAVGRPRREGADVRVGQRVPLVPPLGPVFLAWSEVEDVERWLRALGPGAGEAERARYRDALDVVRRRGFSVGLESGARAESGRALVELVGAPTDERLRGRVLDLIGAMRNDYIALDLADREEVPVSNMAAPVFGERGEVVLALTLQGFAESMTGRAIAAVADRLLSSVLSLTRASGGRAPAAFRPTRVTSRSV